MTHFAETISTKAMVSSGWLNFGPDAGSQDVGDQDLDERVHEVVDLEHREDRGPDGEPKPAPELS